MTDKAAIRKLLSTRATNALFDAGIDSIEMIKQSYPNGLSRVPGLGIVSFREVEATFFPGQKYIPGKKKISRSSDKQARSEKLAEFLHTKACGAYDDIK